MKQVEVSIREITASILYHWVPLMLAILVFALASMCLTYSRQKHGADYERALVEYEESLSESRRRVEARIAELTGRGSDQHEPRVLSISSGNVLPYKYVTQITAHIMYDPVITDIYQTANQYLSYFKSSDFLEILREVLGEKQNQTNPAGLVTINDEQEGLLNSQNPSQLVLRVVGYDEEEAENTALAVYRHLADYGKRIGGSSLEVVRIQTSDLVQDTDVHQLTVERVRATAQQIEAEIATLEAEHRLLEGKRPNNLYGLVVSLAVGAAVGFPLAVLFLIILHFRQLRLIIPQQIQESFGVRYLSGIRRQPGRFLGAFADKIAGNHLIFASLDEAMRYAEASLTAQISSGIKVLFTGTVPEAKSAAASESFASGEIGTRINVTACKSVCISADSMSLLTDADVVILVESLRTSNMREVYRNVACIQQTGKSIAGYVLV